MKNVIENNAVTINDPIPFRDIVQDLEKALGHTRDIYELIEQVSKKEFLKVREDIVAAFKIGEVSAFTGHYDDDVEIGDLSDAVILTTVSRYPEPRPIDMPVLLDERQKWCHQILDALDSAVRKQDGE